MSNKTPSAKNAKTGSGLKLGALSLFLLFVFLIILTIITMGSSASQTKQTFCGHPERKRLSCFLGYEYATTPAQWTAGLSGRGHMPQNTAMLFIFNGADRECIWMKDMKFNLDILWLDSEQKIIRLQDNVSPRTYPKSFCADRTKYVMELNAGMAERLGLQVGDFVQL